MLPLQEMSVNFCKNDEEKGWEKRKRPADQLSPQGQELSGGKTTAETKIKKKTKTMITCGFELVACSHKK